MKIKHIRYDKFLTEKGLAKLLYLTLSVTLGRKPKKYETEPYVLIKMTTVHYYFVKAKAHRSATPPLY